MKKILASILAAISVLSLTACGENPTSSQTANPADTSNPAAITHERKSFAPIEITGDNVLNSVRVFDTMYEDNNQAMFSPLSLNMCLGMVEAGADGDTKKALDAYLGNTDYAAFAEEYLEHSKDFNVKVNNSHTKYQNVFEIANSFWANKNLKFNSDYQKRVSSSFAAELDTLDFSKSDKAADKINSWVNKKTHEMIPSIVLPSMLTEDTAAVLVNTVYFESAWDEEWYFPSEMEKFTNLDGSTTELELMHNGGNSYFENDNATAFSCRYKNGMQFIGILPKKEGDFTLESLDINSLLESESFKYDVRARMPKLNFESSFPLTDALIAAGLGVAFDPDTADFTPMQGSDDECFFISEVIQKTKLELDDEGTRAAAATAVMMENATAAFDPVQPEIKEVFLDRPFAFLIYDDAAEQIVFMGKVTAM